MINKIFVKYFLTIASAVIVSFIVLAAVLLSMTASYSINEKQSSLRISAEKVADLTARALEGSGTFGDILIYHRTLLVFAQGLDTDIIITDIDGNVLIWLYQGNMKTTTKVIDKNIMETAYSKNTYRSTGKFLNLYDDTRYTVGVPYKFSNNTFGGVVFSTSPVSSLTDLLSDVTRMFLLALLTMLVVAFAGLYYATNRLTKPLKEMSDAAKKFAKGEFDIRIIPNSNDEVGQLAISFNNMASSLSKLEEIRRDFIANISHDLKTPMTTISGFVDGILDGTIPKDKQEQYLQLVSDEMQRLSRLVNSILDIARLEGGGKTSNQTVFDVKEMITRVLISHEMSINAKKLSVNINIPENQLLVKAEEDSIFRVLQNLIENAVKFVNFEGNLDVSAYEKDRKVLISIKNSGEGVLQKDVEHIFDRFYKTDKSRSMDKDGSGLGLYITKSLVNLNGEEIWVKTIENQYTEFVFTLTKAE